VVGGLLLIGVTFFAFLLVSLRTKFPPLLKVIRRVNRVVWNPRAMRSAGRPGAYASVIRHAGRTTGKPYQTPVGAISTDDGFVIGLPYGASPDWLKNLLAAGSAVIVHEGSAFRVEAPELMPAAMIDHHFSRTDQRMHRLFGVRHFLFVHRVGAPTTVGDHP